MMKYCVVSACLLVVAGCASNTGGVAPAQPSAERPTVRSSMDTPRPEPMKTDIDEPAKPAVTVGQPNVQVPAVLNFKRNVSFNHKSHGESFACITCHKDTPGKIANFGKDFAHETCKGCHAEKGRNTSCSSCHRG